MKLTISPDSSNTKNIITLLSEAGYSLPCNCGGNAKCNSSIYSFNCLDIPKEEITIELPASVKKNLASPIKTPLKTNQKAGQKTNPKVDQIVDQKAESTVPIVEGVSLIDVPTYEGIGDCILIDLGTTTIAVILIDSKHGTINKSTIFTNPNTIYGLDVITRITSSLNGNKDIIKQQLTTEINNQLAHLCEKNKQDKNAIKNIYIAGNTTMMHLLFGFDAKGLSAEPFFADSSKLKYIVNPFHDFQKSGFHVVPWLSPFIGGDILSGIIGTNLSYSTNTLFVDLGTNGEIVLNHNNKLYATSTSAGPAFEGGALSCGSAAVDGAIYFAEISHGKIKYKTINNKTPIGICGSGAISLFASLLKNHYITVEGILTDKFPKEGIQLVGSLYFTSKDLRQVQSAVAAIAAGIDTLLHTAKLYNEADAKNTIKKIILGGSFGFHLRQNDFQTLNLFSCLSNNSVHCAGNTCLQGLYKLAITKTSANEWNHEPIKNINIVSLGNNSVFKERFISHMTYPD